jgi:hypothetical protein
MTIRNLLMILALAAGGALAQTYGQPVKEIEKEARLSVSGACSISWAAGNDSTSRSCLLYAVPEGKRLAIRSVSAWCAGNTGNNFTRPWLASFVNNGTSDLPEATLLGFQDDPGFGDYEV